MVPKELRKGGILQEVFKQSIEEFDPIGFRATWKYDEIKYKDSGGLSDNLRIFLENETKVGRVKAAFMTPSGKLAKEFDFVNAEVLFDIINEKPHVTVYFSR